MVGATRRKQLYDQILNVGFICELFLQPSLEFQDGLHAPQHVMVYKHHGLLQIFS